MASPQAISKFLSKFKITAYDFDNAADPVDVAWVDMSNYRHFCALVFKSVKAGTGDIDTFKILANAQSNGGGTDIEVAAHALVPTVEDVGDYVLLECTAEQIAQEAADAGITGARYVSVSLELADASDEAVVVYILGSARFAYDQLTTDFAAD